MGHDRYVTFYPLHFDLVQPLAGSLTGPQRVHELMFSELPCFSVTFNGRYLARILVYVSHTKHTCLGC